MGTASVSHSPEPALQLSRGFMMAFPPLAAKIAGRFRPCRKLELEAGLQKTGGDYSPAFQDQFAFSAQEHRADFDHPGRCRQSEGDAPCVSQFLLKFRKRQGLRRGQIDGACEFLDGQSATGQHE